MNLYKTVLERSYLTIDGDDLVYPNLFRQELRVFVLNPNLYSPSTKYINTYSELEDAKTVFSSDLQVPSKDFTDNTWLANGWDLTNLNADVKLFADTNLTLEGNGVTKNLNWVLVRKFIQDQSYTVIFLYTGDYSNVIDIELLFSPVMSYQHNMAFSDDLHVMRVKKHAHLTSNVYTWSYFNNYAITSLSGKYYFEVRLLSSTSSFVFMSVGGSFSNSKPSGNFSNTTHPFTLTGGVGVYQKHNSSNIVSYNGTSTTNIHSSSPTWGAINDIVMCAIDFDNGKIWTGRNGDWGLDNDPAANQGGGDISELISTYDYFYPGFSIYNSTSLFASVVTPIEASYKPNGFGDLNVLDRNFINFQLFNNGDFEQGDFTDFNVVNGSETNKWNVGTSDKHLGSFSAYITNAVTPTPSSPSSYTLTSASIVHFYRDIDITSSNKIIRFQAKVGGELTRDYLTVTVCSNSENNPVAGVNYSPTNVYDIIHIGVINDDFYGYYFDLSDYENTSVKIVFSWRNDSSSGLQPGAVIDDISFTSGD
jgi:hypothetical protein